ncbi:hypothetical protein BHE74_00051421 [Ensete ventricosum]|nr:hypothetical protein BHE74_00051421 [Ensete ventricosum]
MAKPPVPRFRAAEPPRSTGKPPVPRFFAFPGCVRVRVGLMASPEVAWPAAVNLGASGPTLGCCPRVRYDNGGLALSVLKGSMRSEVGGCRTGLRLAIERRLDRDRQRAVAVSW